MLLRSQAGLLTSRPRIEGPRRMQASELRRCAALIEALDDLDAEQQLVEGDPLAVAREREALLRILDRIEIQLQAELVVV